MKMVPLSRNQVVYVDDEDYERVNKFKWWAQANGENYTLNAAHAERHGNKTKRF
jgi:hypothetical protein